MLSLEHITLQYGSRVLLEDVSALISPHDRIGLVGSNGAGKSTLLRIMVGTAAPDEGRISKAAYVTVGYLPQDGITAAGRSLYKEVETAFEDVVTVLEELEEAQESLSTLNPQTPEYADTLEVFGELQHKLEDLDAFRMKSKIERVLMGLGFSVEDMDRQTEEFSGGWQMRIALAKLLLMEPSLLLLDEPTNHLDIDSLQWLEEYLRNYNGAIILVSHDRAFLDSLSTKTIALSMGSMDEYAGNYSFYEKEKEVRKALLQNAYKNQQDRIKQTREFIDRFRYKATKARQVQSRVKQLEKMDLIEIDSEEEQIHFRFPQPQPSGRVVMELKNLSKSYGSKKVFKALEYKIERGDRIAIVGPNGAGKSTLSRILAGVEPFDAGDRVVGYNVVLSYFAQHQAEELDLSMEALEIVNEVATGEIRKKLRSILGSFLFHGDDVFKKVSVLSGGEKSRLALAKMLLQPANFLIMDEPTNHLDMKSKVVLQEALKLYEGTYAIVSHDRHFLDPIVNKVLEVTLTGVKTYLGTVSEYLLKKKEERSGRLAAPAKSAREPAVNEKDRRRVEAVRRQQRSQHIKPLKKELEGVEREIAGLEAHKLELEMTLADPDLYKKPDEAKKASSDHKEVLTRLERLYGEWSKVTDRIQMVEKELSASQ
ncbi:MAG: ABC-F family ATP-binding cassette domain-containing protein [Bacteroidota bacterium]